MKHSLLIRTFSAIFAVLILMAALTTSMFITLQRNNLQEKYEAELRVQAEEVSNLLTQQDKISLITGNSTIRYLVNKKVSDIYSKYNADIWIVNFLSGHVEYIDRSLNTSQWITDDATISELKNIQEGNEIARQGLFPDALGESIVTIGVPWYYGDDDCTVVGAVLLHIPVDEFHVSILQILPMSLIPMLVALVFAAVVSYFLARSQTKPIQAIESAVRQFATGDLSSRITLTCGGELEDLAGTINNMAAELENLETSRKDFVANVSHELRSPMTSMKGYVQAMLDGVIPEEETPKYLGIVMDETNRLTSLVSDLLDLSRLESGRFPMNIAPFDANELMRRAFVRYVPRIEEKNIDVDIDLAEEPVFVSGDVGRITQVVSNLVDNAVKFMNGEDSKLTLRTVREGNLIRFVVQDNGPGIGPEDLPRIQERFFKVDKAHTAGMGTGLGLSICKTILQQHGSMMEISSEPGVKTVFSFALSSIKDPRKENASLLAAHKSDRSESNS